MRFYSYICDVMNFPIAIASFDQARRFAHRNRITSRSDWALLYRKGLLPANMPRAPYQCYKSRGWVSEADFYAPLRLKIVERATRAPKPRKPRPVSVPAPADSLNHFIALRRQVARIGQAPWYSPQNALAYAPWLAPPEPVPVPPPPRRKGVYKKRSPIPRPKPALPVSGRTKSAIRALVAEKAKEYIDALLFDPPSLYYMSEERMFAIEHEPKYYRRELHNAVFTHLRGLNNIEDE